MITIEQVNMLMNTAAYWVIAVTGACVAYEELKKIWQQSLLKKQYIYNYMVLSCKSTCKQQPVNLSLWEVHS